MFQECNCPEGGARAVGVVKGKDIIVRRNLKCPLHTLNSTKLHLSSTVHRYSVFRFPMTLVVAIVVK